MKWGLAVQKNWNEKFAFLNVEEEREDPEEEEGKEGRVERNLSSAANRFNPRNLWGYIDSRVKKLKGANPPLGWIQATTVTHYLDKFI